MHNQSICTRRTFLQHASLFAGTTALATVLPPQEATAKVAALNLVPVLTSLGRFAAGIASTVITRVIQDWLDGDDTAAQDSGRAARDDLSERGQNDLSQASVWLTNNYYFYGATNPQNYQGYAPFLYPAGKSTYGYTFLGGPAIVSLPVILARLRQNYPRHQAAALGQALVPRSMITGSNIYFPFEDNWSASYLTNWGYVNMSYTVKSYPSTDKHGNQIAGEGSMGVAARKSARQTYAAVGTTIYYA